jgi:hypothetical protein
METPWMGMKITVDRYLPGSSPRREIAGADPTGVKDERLLPALKLHLESGGHKSEPQWLSWTDAVRVTLPEGEAALAYRAPVIATPFRVTLLDFNSDKYPGSNMAATFESFVKVDDPEYGVSEHHISMNHPLHYRGYIFFQASYVEGDPMMSIFSVARSPGLPLVYIGTTLISIGVVWMFYIKPYLARRQAARALAAHRLREGNHEKDAAEPAAAPASSSPPEPASGRA